MAEPTPQSAVSFLPLLTDHYNVSCVTNPCRGRERFVDEEFDLDLTYITDKIIGRCCVDQATDDLAQN